MKKLLFAWIIVVFTTILVFCSCGESTNTSLSDTPETKQGPYAELENSKIGDSVSFGTINKKPIDWLVLDIQDEKMLVISKHILDYRQYDTKESGVSWESCTLRNWLNDYFFNTSFSYEEKKMILSTFTESVDKVFLLSSDEAEKFFRSNRERCCDGREWWLRSDTKGYFSFVRDYVDSSGEIWAHHAEDPSGVRPAMWIKIKE